MPHDGSDYRRGDELSSAWLTGLLRKLKAARILPGEGIEVVTTDGGQLVRATAVPTQRFVAIIGDRVGTKYSWTEQAAAAAGGWVSTARAGRADASLPGTAPVDPAYEYNLRQNISAGTRVEMFRTTIGDLRFQLEPCDSTSQLIPIPGILSWAVRRRAEAIQAAEAERPTHGPGPKRNTSLLTLQEPEEP